jgi:hypothetical protein
MCGLVGWSVFGCMRILGVGRFSRWPQLLGLEFGYREWMASSGLVGLFAGKTAIPTRRYLSIY